MMDDFSCLDERTTADRSRRQTDGEGGAKTDTGILVRSASADGLIRIRHLRRLQKPPAGSTSGTSEANLRKTVLHHA